MATLVRFWVGLTGTLIGVACNSVLQLNREVVEERGLRYGDVLPPPRRMSRIRDGKVMAATIRDRGVNRWPNNVVPYVISDQYSASEKETLKRAIESLESASCFKFPERTTQSDFLHFQRSAGCYSYVGRTGGEQTISLGRGCLFPHVIQHEVLHALGLEHEHQRPDRDRYIRIEFRNVEAGKADNFEKIRPNRVDLYEQPYDYLSIMHYDGQAFGKYDKHRNRWLDTMIPLKNGVTLAENDRLTELDLAKLRILGKCPASMQEAKFVKRPFQKPLPSFPVDFHEDDACRDYAESCVKVICLIPLYRTLVTSFCQKTCNLCH